MRRSLIIVLTAAALALGLVGVVPPPAGHADRTRVKIPGLRSTASVIRDVDGIPHLKAGNVHDLFLLQGWIHAEDRLFQMDVTRRRGSGTLAELLGSAALPSDVQLRTLGLRRTAERSLTVLSPQTQGILAAYASGVNAWTLAIPCPTSTPRFG